jgi:allantoinase
MGGKIYAGGPAVLPAPVPKGSFDFPNWTWREYGKRVGIWRLMRVFDAHGIPVTAPANGQFMEEYPEALEAFRSRGWDLSCCHGYIEDVSMLDFSDDPSGHEQYVDKSLAVHEKLTGTPARGWLSPAASFLPDTFDLLADRGISWIGGFLSDDKPYWIEAAGRPLVALPYNTELNDYTVFTRGYSFDNAYVASVSRYVRRLLQESQESGVGCVATIPMHPHVLGQPFRIHLVEQLLEELRTIDGMWWATMDQVASHFAKEVPR